MSRPTVNQVAASLATHEEVCAERYGGIITRLSRLETLLISAGGVLMTGMGGILVKLLFFSA